MLTTKRGRGVARVETAASGNPFAFFPVTYKLPAMTQPLALVFYERLLPGSQVVNRLQDLHYRVQTVAEAGALATAAEQHLPMLALVDLQASRGDALAAIAQTRSAPATSHLPIIAFTGDSRPAALAAGQEAGASLVAQDQALLNHLPELLEQVLRVE